MHQLISVRFHTCTLELQHQHSSGLRRPETLPIMFFRHNAWQLACATINIHQGIQDNLIHISRHRHPILACRRPGIISRHCHPILAWRRPGIISRHRHPILACRRPGIISRHHHLILACRRPGIISRHHHPILACRRPGIISHHRHLILACRRPGIISCHHHLILACERPRIYPTIVSITIRSWHVILYDYISPIHHHQRGCS